MDIRDAYNQWSHTYDSDDNKTRDLDRVVTGHVLGHSHFTAIIEAGCGTGKNTLLFSRIGTKVQAIDFSEDMLRRATVKLRHVHNVEFVYADLIQCWPYKPCSADLVSCNLVLEHVRNLEPVFAEAARVLRRKGQLFVCELHPYRQYQGVVATYHDEGQAIQIPAFVHHISDFLTSAQQNGFTLTSLQEWWHEKDDGKLPRLVSFLFEKSTSASTQGS
ncbi:MAG: class I SAM-dependent methyltransferase [Candidatus Binatia bacterium]